MIDENRIYDGRMQIVDCSRLGGGYLLEAFFVHLERFDQFHIVGAVFVQLRKL